MTEEIKKPSIVISGISGRFPECNSMNEFKQALYEGIDMVTEDNRRWPPGTLSVPLRSGKIKDLSHFDAAFFNVLAKQADPMDPQLRMLLETSFEAIVDAGINPNTLRGSNTGVFIGAMSTEASDMWRRNAETASGYLAVGAVGHMLANRISFHFDLHGPSLMLDTGCSSSLVALNEAITAIQSGQCDAALVGGTNLLLNPMNSYVYNNLGVLSKDGKCKAFDATGSGFVRSEAVVVILIQKEQVAKRMYASILGIGTNNDGFKKEGVSFPSGKMQNKLIREVYAKSGVNPLDVCYVEAHATGTKVGDPQEINSVCDFFCKDRKTPLLIGGIKSNMGHAEGAAALCAIAKILISFETGIIPGNLHYKTPNPAIPGLEDGRLQVVDKNLKLPGDIVAISSFGIGGQNAHAILKAHKKTKIAKINENIPQIIAVSGRTKKAVEVVLKKAYKNRTDSEFLGLLDEIYKNNIENHDFRGFTVLNTIPHTVKVVSGNYQKKRPLWYVYSGMGSQWSKMAKDLMQLDSFRNSIEKSSKALKLHGFDLEQLLLNSSDKTFTNLLNSFVSITAMQVALTDVLKTVGLEPDGLIGHSMGELGCAYADGSLTTEQAVLASLSRGQAVFNTNLPVGAMASINLGWEELQHKCPSDIVLACHNSTSNVTVSGPQKSILKFISKLTDEGVFAKKVECGDFGFHSKYIAEAGPILQKMLVELIPNPKPRSKRWISSSIPESNWHKPLAELSSPAYFVNNFLSPVLFHEALQHIPENAIVIEVAPTGLMQAILKRSLNLQVDNINLMSKSADNNLKYLVTSLGKLYNAGAQPQLGNLYPSLSFPVGKGTPMISSLIQWDHSTEWKVPRFEDLNSDKRELAIEIDLNKESNYYLQGYKIDGQFFFPTAGLLCLVWQGLANLRNQNFEEMPVVFKNVQFYGPTKLKKDGTIKFQLNILQGSGEFELSESGRMVTTGKIYVPQDVEDETITVFEPNLERFKEHLKISADDIYKELRLCGYQYSGEFCSITEANMYSDLQYNKGKLKWNNNWVTFIDGVLQFQKIEHKSRKLVLPAKIENLLINPKKHIECIENLDKNVELDVHFHVNFEVVKSGGIELGTVNVTSLPRKPAKHDTLRTTRFEFVPDKNLVPLSKEQKSSKRDALSIILQIVGENSVLNKKTVKIIEVSVNSSNEDILINDIVEIMESVLPIKVDGTLVISDSVDSTIFDNNNIKCVVINGKEIIFDEDHNLMVVENALSNKNLKIFKDANVLLKDNGFVLLEEEIDSIDPSKLVVSEWEVVAYQVSIEKVYILLRKPIKVNLNEMTFQITSKNFDWVESLAETMKFIKTKGNKIYLFEQSEKHCGLIGFGRSILCEPDSQGVRCISIEDQSAAPFNLKTYEEQLRKDLIYNVFKNNQWGCYRPIVLDIDRYSKNIKTEHAYVNTLNKEDMSSFNWIESPLKYYKNEDDKMCHVYYNSLNSKDLTSTEQENLDSLTKIEFSGRNSKGLRVMGMATAKSISTTVLLEDMVWEVSEKYSLEEAATIPVVYSTSYYALLERGKLQSGESILIYDGTSGIGLASIAIALNMRCKVFTTVNSQDKREFLKKRFPELTDDCIGNLRDATFKQQIIKQTKRRGVDVVLNSSPGNLLQASLKCLTANGRFLEIGTIDVANNFFLATELFRKNVTFHGIASDVIIKDNKIKHQIWNYVNDGIANGTVRPLPTTIFSDDEVETAFNFMASNNHIGKILIKIRDEKTHSVQSAAPKTVSAIPCTYVDPQKSYLLVGGLGGVGFETIFWLISRGARKIVVASRGGIKSNYQKMWLKEWKNMGIDVLVTTIDCSSYEGAKRLLQEANNLAPLGGILNVAKVLRDALIENQTKTNFEEVARPKIQVTQNLDTLSRKMAPHLDFFIVFSTALVNRGNTKQSNYSMVNHIMDRICEDRQKDGLPSLSIQWGTIADIGTFEPVVNENHSGMLPQKLSSLFSTLEFFMRQPYPVVSSFILNKNKQKEDKFQHTDVANSIANILGIRDVESLPLSTHFSKLGVDSLMTAEIKQMFEWDYNFNLTQQEIGTLTLEDLVKLTGDSNL